MIRKKMILLKNKYLQLRKKYYKGFTLVEILISFVILSILINTLVVVANKVQERAHDANIRTTLSAIRTQATDEYFEQSPYSFITICGGGPVDLTLQRLKEQSGIIEVDHQCVSNQDEWVTIFPLKTTQNYYCADSNGFVGEVTGFLDSSLLGNINCTHATFAIDEEEGEPIIPPPSYACSDATDNDWDTYIDFPEDVGCDNNEDNDETNAFQPPVNTNPNITLYGDNPYVFYSPSANPFSGVGHGANKYSEPGYLALDSEQGDITTNVVTVGPTLISTGGPKNCRMSTYSIVYTITDEGGLTDQESRTVVHHKCNQ